jgi:hypothetical protein
MHMKSISFYRKNVFGRPLDYIVNPKDAEALQVLTGSLTCTQAQREAVTTLSGGHVTFEQVIEPALKPATK